MNKTVMFFTNQICGRGTTDLVYNYAKYNESLLNNNSIIVTFKSPFPHIHNQSVLNLLKKEMNVIEISDSSHLNKLTKPDVFYICKYGTNDNLIMNDTKNIIHSIFPVKDPHGDEYIYLSEYISNKCEWNKWLEPIIEQNFINENWRKLYNIPDGDLIFGRSGGYDSFDIEFVKSSIIDLINCKNNIHFWFTNTEKFYTHPKIKYFNYLNKSDLNLFINSCDAMVHARTIGECFGISIAEFSIRNKPIITYTKSTDLAHLDYLKNFYGYSTESEFKDIIYNFTINTKHNWNFYKSFSPSYIMNKFNSLL